FEKLDVKVSARMFANKTFAGLVSGGSSHDLKMTEGAMITGVVMHEGKPLKGVNVGVVSADRSMENFTGNFEVGTDDDGRFLFVNLPPNTDYNLYGTMKTLKAYGALPVSHVRSSADGKSTDEGKLIVGAAHSLKGHVVLADGKSIPSKTRLLVGREEAWDTLTVDLDKNGNFSATGIPSESVSLSVSVKGYRMSAQNASLDRLNTGSMRGRVDQDIPNLVVLLEKGDRLPPDYNMNGPDSERVSNRPLRGAGGPVDHSRDWAVSGHVV